MADLQEGSLETRVDICTQCKASVDSNYKCHN